MKKKSHKDLAHGWWRKADSDLTNAQMCLDTGLALDTACFHAQQAAEKYLKAYLTWNKIDFPYTHNLSALVAICQHHDKSFRDMRTAAQCLTPYAVEARYDDEFWPDDKTTREAVKYAHDVRGFLRDKLPRTFKP